MKMRICILGILVSVALVAEEKYLVLDPDDYPDGTVLNHVIPEVSLLTAGRDNLPHPPRPFDVTVHETTFPWQPPTGDSIFAHMGVPFWNTDRRLRMDFNGLVYDLSIDFQGGDNLVAQQGVLEVYALDGTLTGTYLTQPLFGGQVETMTITHLVPDIAWAIAYTTTGSPFGRLDHLVFTAPVPVPEPQTIGLLGLGAIAGVGWGRSRRRSS